MDEAGTPELFTGRGRPLLPGNGVSRFFVIGLLEIRDVKTVSYALKHLRAQILRDPDLKELASLKPEQRKTALQFHAKNDHTLVRERVFGVLCRPYHHLRFTGVIREREALRREALERRRVEPGYKFRPNDLYDEMVSRVFSGRLHHDNQHSHAYFSRRGKTDREAALTTALFRAHADYQAREGLPPSAPSLRFFSASPEEHEGLQIADYFCWALQRLLEQHEKRWWGELNAADKIRCVVDLDDPNAGPNGRIYTKTNPLTLPL